MNKVSRLARKIQAEVSPSLTDVQARAVAEWDRSGTVRKRWIVAGATSLVWIVGIVLWRLMF